MSLLDDIFGSKVKVPNTITVDPSLGATASAGFNQGQLQQFYNYAPGMAEFMKNLFNNTNPNVQNETNSLYGVANDLINTGQTKAMGDYFAYSRRVGLETAAATGAPVSSQFAQNLGGSLGVNQILQNQLQGVGIANNLDQQQMALTQSFINPSLQFLSANLTRPSDFNQVAEFNASQGNDMALKRSVYDAQPDPFAKWITDLTANTIEAVAGKAGGAALGGL